MKLIEPLLRAGEETGPRADSGSSKERIWGTTKG
jgi:hypothetical protein